MKQFKVGLIALIVLLSGCQSKSSESKKSFTIGLPAETKYLDTVLAQDAVTRYVRVLMYDTMFQYESDGSIIPMLAKAYSVSDDGLVYTIPIIDAKWSDGKQLTAHDFVYAVKRALNYGPADAYFLHYISQNVKNASKYVGANLEDMVDLGYEAIDDQTIQITLEKPVPYFVQMLTCEIFSPQREDIATLKESSWANNPDVPVIGAYKLKEIKDKEEITLVKNDQYYLADQVEVEELHFLIMPDQQAQLNAFKTGEIDLGLGVPSNVVKEFDGKPELLILKPFVLNYFVIINAFESDVAALENPDIRRALALAINRDDILKALDGGDLQYPLHGFIPEGMQGISGDFRVEQDEKEKLLDTNVEEAKKLLEKAGYSTSNPLKLTYTYNSNQMHDTVSQILQAMWKEVGVEVTLQSSEMRVFFDEREMGKFEIARHAMSAVYLDPMIYFEMYDSNNQTTKVINDPKYDKMLADSNKELDPVKRMELLHEVERYFVQEQVYVIPLFGYVSPYLLNPNFSNITSSPTGQLDLRFIKIK